MQVVVAKNKNQQQQQKNRAIINYCYNRNSIGVNQQLSCHLRWLILTLLLVVVVCFNNKVTSCQAFSILNRNLVGGTSLSTRSMIKTPTTTTPVATTDTMEDEGQSGKNSINYSLGGKILREIVIDATIQDTMIDESSLIDLQGIVWLEHINLIIGTSKELGQYFYGTFLGCTPDASKSFHMNMGQQQFHLAVAEKDNPTQTICGSIGLAVPNLQSIRNRIQDALIALNNTQFAILYDDDDDDDMLTVRCPWGNIFHLYDIRKDDHYKNDNNDATSSTKKMVQSHSVGGQYGPHRMAVRGKPGIRYIEFTCPKNSCDKIAQFYRNLLDCTVREQEVIVSTTTTTTCAIVNVGPGVQLIFIETTATSDNDNNNDYIEALNRMKGVHICIYVPNFVKLYNRLNCINPNISNDKNSNNSIIWTNPRFVHLDTCETIAEAIASRTLRFKDIVDIDRNNDSNNDSNNEQYKIVYELEHETRAITHGQYMKVPNYEPR